METEEIKCNMCKSTIKSGDNYAFGIGFRLCKKCFVEFIKENLKKVEEE